MTAELGRIYLPSSELVAREIEGEFILVPLTANRDDAEDDLFILNDTGAEIWKLLDGKRNLAQVVAALAEIYAAEAGEIARDVLALVDEMLQKAILIEA